MGKSLVLGVKVVVVWVLGVKLNLEMEQNLGMEQSPGMGMTLAMDYNSELGMKLAMVQNLVTGRSLEMDNCFAMDFAVKICFVENFAMDSGLDGKIEMNQSLVMDKIPVGSPIPEMDKILAMSRVPEMDKILAVSRIPEMDMNLVFDQCLAMAKSYQKDNIPEINFQLFPFAFFFKKNLATCVDLRIY